jgi:pimeloyl-ACP methyl ester carboxylesterase
MFGCAQTVFAQNMIIIIQITRLSKKPIDNTEMMRPITFAGCFGWLHEAPDVLNRDIGVVICGALGHEALWSHRGQRFIAESLSQHGISALRFDYRGTGDALGLEEDPERLEIWLADIRAAVNEIRSLTKVQRVALVGLRLGGALASLAAQQIPEVQGLALLAPVIRGSAYLRELSILQTSWLNISATHVEKTAPPESVSEALGHRFYSDTVDQIKALDLRQSVSAPASHVLIMEHGSRPLANGLTEHYRNQGAQVELHSFDEYPTLMTETGVNQLPVLAANILCGWLEGWSASRAEPQAREAVFPEASLSADGFLEQSVLFGETGKLFGIYCRPKEGPDPGLAVVLPNTGGNHHVGDARLWVLLARHLARSGIASLRMDLGKLGDSLEAAATSPEESLYDAAGIDDLAAGAAWLRAKQHHTVVAIGVCSGAYLAVRTAVSHGCLDGLIAINQDRFVWGDAQTHATASTSSIAKNSTMRSQMQSAKQLGKWLRVLRGDIKVLPKIKSLLERIAARRVASLRRVLSRARHDEADHGGMAALQLLSQQGVKTHFLFGTFDIGLEVGEFHFGSGFSAVKRLPNLSVSLNPKIDHSLFLYDGREAVWAEIQTFLGTHFAAAAQIRNASSQLASQSAMQDN